MTLKAIDGPGFLGALRRATVELQRRVDEVNSLNVFPVPDGDTGTNMLATLRAAVEEGTRSADAQLGALAEAVSSGALIGARGNSGVILSQFLRGMAEALSDRSSIDASALADALEHASVAAKAAVARPVEGTMLSVGQGVAQAARAAAADGADVEGVLATAVEAAAAAVAGTPAQLAVLREAGVVDAGGRGLELILHGMLAHLRGDTALAFGAAVGAASAPPVLEGLEDDGFGYETVFVVTPFVGQVLDPAEIRRGLERLGESVLVGGDERAVKVHVHNERPDEVIAFGLTLGTLSRISIENLDRQVHDRSTGAVPRGGASTEQLVGALSVTSTAAAPEARMAMVAVATGDGFERIYRALGADALRADDANASAGELADAIRATGAPDVLVLPNNPNVRLAAEQAARLCAEQRVQVVATRNQAEGVAALLSVDRNADAAANAAVMVASAYATRTLQVAQAVRDARMGSIQVRRGQHLVLDGEQRLITIDDDLAEALLNALLGVAGEVELITLYRGVDVDDQAARELLERLRDELEGIEIELVDGGQRHYSYVVAAE